MNGILHQPHFLTNSEDLFDFLGGSVKWDERMTARKTASFGKAYNYSQIDYPYQEFLPQLTSIISLLEPIIGFKPNNCLINYYLDGKSSMGFHSDQTDILEVNTGIAIVSLGETRTLQFKKIENPEETMAFELESGSLIYMTQEIQAVWKHAIPKTNTDKGRISLTFREMR